MTFYPGHGCIPRLGFAMGGKAEPILVSVDLTKAVLAEEKAE